MMHHTGDDLVHPPLDRRPGEERAHSITREDAGEDAGPRATRWPRGEEAGEGGDEHLPLDADVDHTGPLADHPDAGGRGRAGRRRTRRSRYIDSARSAGWRSRRRMPRRGRPGRSSPSPGCWRSQAVVIRSPSCSMRPCPWRHGRGRSACATTGARRRAGDREQHVDDLGLDAGVELQAGGAGRRAPTSKAAGIVAERVGPGEQGDGDAVEAEVGVEPGLVAVHVTEGLDAAGQTGEAHRTGPWRQDHPVDPHARVAGRVPCCARPSRTGSRGSCGAASTRWPGRG